MTASKDQRNAPYYLSKLLINIRQTALLAVFAHALFTTQAHAGSISGSLDKWAPLTIDFNGPQATETDASPNPFLDYRLTVTMTAPSGNTYLVPGFFAGDGLGGSSGTHWQIRFAADETGEWTYSASMRSGANVSIDTSSNAGSAVTLSNPSGNFTVSAQSSDAPGFLAYGRLEYTGEHYLKFRDGPYWIKSGTDSPENFLGFEGIDGTVDRSSEPFLHNYDNHRGDAQAADPYFTNAATGADSLGITGALNYLSDQGVNSIYFLPMNLGGDGQETYPFVGGANTTYNKTHYDLSKLYQWNQVLNHAQRRGLALNIQLSETERTNERWLDNGSMGIQRKLFFRELIARFGYLLAAKWNLGEENDFPVSELRQHASYIAELDWTKKPIAVHTQINDFKDYELLLGDSLFSASSIQYDPEHADDFVETWRQRTSSAGRKWVIDMDENTGGVSKNNASIRRKQILYDVFFSGGNLEWYFGYHPLPLGGDITAGDFRQREATWQTMRYAREFMESELPFWRMEPADNLISGESSTYGGAEVFAAANEIYAIYLPQASGNPRLNLSAASGSFSQRWFNPRNGQFEGNTRTIEGGQQVSLGSPPSATNEDWVVLVKSHSAPALAVFTSVSAAQASVNSGDDDIAVAENVMEEEDSSAEVVTELPADEVLQADDVVASEPVNYPPEFTVVGELGAAKAGSNYRFNVLATDENGVAPIVTAQTLPSGMSIVSVTAGVANIEWQVPDDAPESVSFELLAIDVADSSLRATLPITLSIEQAIPTGSADADTPIINTESVLVTNSFAVLSAEQTDLPPIIVGVQNETLVVGRTYRKKIVPIDPDGIVASLRAVQLPGDATFLDNGDGSREFLWTPSDVDIGEHEVRFIAIDSGSTPHAVQNSATYSVVNAQDVSDEELKLTYANTNYAPIFVPLTDQQTVAGQTLTFTVNPIDPDGVPALLHVMAPPSGATFTDNGNGSRTFSWATSAQDTGELQLMFIATDSQDINIVVEQNVSIEVLAN